MASRLFALIIGIDQYKSGDIWNLTSCVDDALNIKRWLLSDLNVPRHQVCLLLDEKATKRTIEDKFVSHLVSNPAIQSGDAILIYFAGHGTSVAAPDGWCKNNALHTQILCPYDYDTKGKGGRVSGISDWSMHAMLHDLCQAKGDNITLLLDCCFSPARSRLNTLTRRCTRWTPTTKVTADDLYAGLWPGAQALKVPGHGQGFYQKTATTHVALLASSLGERAMEDKEGGRFTVALLEAKDSVQLHRTSCAELAAHLAIKEDSQHVVCVGQHRKRAMFGGAPFVSDSRFVPATPTEKNIRIDAGAIHGIVEGTVFSIHEHNYAGSLNPVLATLHAFEVHPTWCLARSKFPLHHMLDAGWARITHWNNKTPFRVHLKKTCSSFMQWWRLHRQLPSKKQEGSVGGFNVQRVKKASQADISVQAVDQHIAIEHHDNLLRHGRSSVVYAPVKDPTADLSAIDAAARFHLHLHRRNSLAPLRDHVSMKLYRLDRDSWEIHGQNHLVDGKATIAHDKETLFAVSLENKSGMDLWPYLFWMDAGGYNISSIYHPDPSVVLPPLPDGAQFLVGTGSAGSEALAFHLNEGETSNMGFLKLFISTVYVPMGIVEQGPSAGFGDVNHVPVTPAGSKPSSPIATEPVKELWDSLTATVTIVRCD
ncbi:hypothetical protein DENSPDRAFT_135841 [Dentipellis sp. KUC8613]|nr:hypothetical protein DENSPDRAFT_135841 [Dentipellis sp. KUC8613]